MDAAPMESVESGVGWNSQERIWFISAKSVRHRVADLRERDWNLTNILYKNFGKHNKKNEIHIVSRIHSQAAFNSVASK